MSVVCSDKWHPKEVGVLARLAVARGKAGIATAVLIECPWWLRIFGVPRTAWYGCWRAPFRERVRLGPFATADEAMDAIDRMCAA